MQMNTPHWGENLIEAYDWPTFNELSQGKMYLCAGAHFFPSLTGPFKSSFPNQTVALETPAAARLLFKNSRMKHLDLWKFQQWHCSLEKDMLLKCEISTQVTNMFSIEPYLLKCARQRTFATQTMFHARAPVCWAAVSVHSSYSISAIVGKEAYLLARHVN